MVMGTLLTAQNIFGVIFIVIALVQFYFARNYARTIKQQGTTGPQTFAPMTTWLNYVSSIIFLVVGLSLIFGSRSH